MVLDKLPLFPLQTVLYPGSILPLRIFEVRYLDLIQRCIENGAPFGVVSLTQGSEVVRPGQSEALAPVGTVATIIHHEAPQPGLKLIRCLGQQRFRTSRIEKLKHGLWVADIRYTPHDRAVKVPQELDDCRRLLDGLSKKIPPTAQQTIFEHPPSPEQWHDCGWLANRWCQILPLPIDLKQRLLELDSPLIRLELVHDLLEKLGLRDTPDSPQVMN
jgi:uncharacterized protein